MDRMDHTTEKPQSESSGYFRRLALAVAFIAALLGILFLAYRLGLFGSFVDKSLRAVQTQIGEQQNLLIPGMPACGCVAPECGPALTPPPAPTPVIAAASPTSAAASVFGLAWFHKPPEAGTSAADIAANHRYIHLTGAADIPFRNRLRDAGYKGPIFTYTTISAVEGPGPYKDSSVQCDANYQGYDNQLAFDRGDFCKYIHPNESWFLHNGKGERIVDDYFGSGRISYLMNPGDPDWRAFAWSRLKHIKADWAYDGIWLDNVDLDLSRSWREVTNSDGTVKEYENDEQWREAVKGALSGLRQELGTDYPIWANLVGGGLGATSWDPYAPYLDGAMDESFSVRWIDQWRTTEQWQGQIERATRWLNMGKGLVMVGQGPKDDTQRLDFTLASYLLVANGDAFYRYTRFDSYYESLWLYPEFDTARSLGAPLGPCKEITPGVWRRDFAGGYVEVNPTDHTGRLVPVK